MHSDRETDPQDRDRNTALMQRANQANSKNSLLHLLELQLELENIDQSAINNIGEDRLKHYNKILKKMIGGNADCAVRVYGSVCRLFVKHFKQLLARPARI
ncbi:hypothetical protein J2794_006309 [Paraburkholderia terricola]|uniref:hypothetical protein n=1 Tax=Paraburkholderia terricola TaxID=169427 RepID=UPI002854F231|nr:hypothetical protein [Paraburkholderia terricola]MDR6450169.1 hypothetical protein [Paraburkholderia terricola]